VLTDVPLDMSVEELTTDAAERPSFEDRQIAVGAILRQGGERMCTFAKINRPRRQQHASSSGDIDHDREAEARTARNTAVNWAASSMPDETRTTAPASLTSIPDAVDAARGTVVAGMASLTIGTKLGVVVVPATLGKSWRMVRRQPKTCCEQICQRRATSDTRAPGTRVSATIRAFSSADQRRRRPGPVRTSTRRNALFASSLTSNIWIARSPVPQQNQALPGRPLKKGFRAPLTLKRQGITLDRSTLSTWVGRACWWLKPLYELVVSDATPIRIVIRHC
jgi:hypothetical protein